MKELLQFLRPASLLLILVLGTPIQVASPEGEAGSSGDRPDIGVDECASTLHLLAAVPRDGVIDLTWTGFEDPALASYVITYTYGTGGGDADQGSSPISDIPPTTHIYSLTGVTNYVFYTITVAARDGSNADLAVSNSVRVMPTDILLYLPVIVKAMPNHCYYVAPYGDDNNPGTESRPWATVHKAATTAVAGDTVIFKDGTYNMPGEESSWNSGTSGSPIVFEAENRRGAVWLQTGDANKQINLTGIEYITFRGIVVEGDQTYRQYWHIFMEHSKHVILDDCEIRNGGGVGVGLNGYCTHITIQNCTIHPENARYPLDGIEITHSRNQYIHIDNTEIYHVEHEGINVIQAADVRITNCHIHDVGSHGIDLRNVIRCEVSDCRIHDCDTGYGVSPSSYHNGIRIVEGAQDITILRNEIYHNETSGIHVREDVVGPVDIYDNTFYDNNLNPNTADSGSVRFRTDPDTSNEHPTIRFKNNVVYVTRAALTYFSDAPLEAGIDADYNLLYSSSGTQTMSRNGTNYTSYAAYQAAGYEPHSVVAYDPDMDHPASADFTLQPGSPAIDAGVDVGEPYSGSAPDIGAHEYTAASSPWPGYYNLRMTPEREQYVIAIAKRLGMEPEDGDVIWYTIKTR